MVRLAIEAHGAVLGPNLVSTPRDASGTPPRRERALALGIGQ